MGTPAVPMRQRFWAKVDKAGPFILETRCWIWTAALNRKGYGTIHESHRGSRRVLAHRFSFELHARQPIPEGLSVLHRCDNPACVRFSHLRLGTLADNNADMLAKGRVAHGRRLPAAKLTETEVLDVRRRRAEGVTQRAMAKEYGVNQSTISEAVRGVTWARVLGRPSCSRLRRT